MKRGLIPLHQSAARRYLTAVTMLPMLVASVALTPQAITASMSSTSGQDLMQSSPLYEQEAEKLRTAKPETHEFLRASLHDVLRFLAEASGINYMALPEEEGGKTILVTCKMTASPFSALETISNNYGITLVYDQNMWHMRPLDDKQLIARTYHIKHNAQENVETVSSGSGDQFGPIGRDAAATGRTGGLESGGGGMGGGGGSAGMEASGNVSLQGTPVSHLASNADEMVDKIKELIGIQSSGFDAAVARPVSVDEFGSDQLKVPPTIYRTKEQTEEGAGGEGESKSAVFWNADNSDLIVVCIRAQHQLVEEFLRSVDKPQPLIAIEVKFFETSKDPRKQMGIDWSSTLDGGLPVSFNQADFTTTSQQVAPGITQLFDSATPRTNWGGAVSFTNQHDNITPQGAILSTKNATANIRALLADRDTTSVSYPRVLTVNNREVVIQNTVNKPILASASSASPGLGGVSTQTIQYLPIGTTINVLPKVMRDGTVKMSVALVLSNVIGSDRIGGNDYPVASSRKFTAPLSVDDGYTVAIAGLDEAYDSRTGSGIPILSSIPGLGWAFKSTDRSRTKKNLMIFITPKVMGSGDEGVSEKPMATVPIRPSDRQRKAPVVFNDGTLEGGLAKVGEAVQWCDREQRFIANLIKEARATKETYREINNLKATCDALLQYIAVERPNNPEWKDRLDLHEWNLHRIADGALKLKLDTFWNTFPEFLGR